MITISHIGFGGHGLRIKNAILSYKKELKILNYSHKRSHIIRFSEIILKSHCIFISSPSSTHVNYLEALRDHGYNGYIYCEKPGLDSIDDLHRFNQVIEWFRGRLLIGYHRPYTKHHGMIRDIIVDDEFGQINSMYIQEGFGLAYSSMFNNSWRSKNILSVASVGLSHILSSFLFFFPQLAPNDFSATVIRNKENGHCDTAHIISNRELPYVLHGMYSWGSPVHEYMRIVSTNCIINLEDGIRLLMQRPRDLFDNNGQYTSPARQCIELPKITIIESVHNFLDYVDHKLGIPEEQPRLASLISQRCLEAVVVE
jgi:predicted dehydrogenase